MTDHPDLDATLSRLVATENRTRFAEESGLSVRDGRVLVVVELDESAARPEGYDLDVQAAFGNRIEAYVAIDDLGPLADESAVSSIRPPDEAVPQNSTSDPRQ